MEAFKTLSPRCSSVPFIIAIVYDFQGFAKLTQPEWIALALVRLCVAISFILNAAFCSSKRANNWQRLSEPKIVDKITFKDDEEMLKVCRCWKSGTFPLCDGTHTEYCNSGKDNAGPALIFHEKKNK